MSAAVYVTNGNASRVVIASPAAETVYVNALAATGSFIPSLGDPNADRIVFWDDSAGAYAYLTAGSGLTITGTTITASGGGGSGDVATDTIWAAKGDIVQGTGNDTAAVLSIGTNGQLLRVNAGATALEYFTSTYLLPADIGVSVQAYDADLTTIASLTATTDNFIVSVSSAWDSRTPAQVRATLDLEAGTDFPSLSTFNDHSARHESGGSDAIKLDDLAAPDDNTDLNATTSAHGLLPKLGGGTSNFLRADGSWATPAGGGDVSDGDTLSTGLTFPNAGLHILDTNASHDLIISPGSDLTADRTLTITTGDASRTLTLSGNADITGTNTGDQDLSAYAKLAGATFTGDVKSKAGIISWQAGLADEYYYDLGFAGVLTADRTFTIDAPDADTILTMTGDATISGTNTGDQTSVSGSSGSCTGNAATATNVAVGGITGLGTGVGTALAVQTNTAGGPVTGGAITSSALTMTTARLLGRTTASTGAVEEITVGTGLSLSAGALTGNIENVSSTSTLGSDFTLDSTGNYQDTGLSISLPAAGTYLIICNFRLNMRMTSGTGYISLKLYNSTDSADVTDSIRLGFISIGTTQNQLQSAYSWLVTVDSADTIKLYSGRFDAGSAVFDQSILYSDSAGKITLAYIKLVA